MLAVLLAGFAALVSAVTTRRGLAVAAVISVLLVGYTLVSVVNGIAAEHDGGTLGEWVGVLSPYTLVDGFLRWAFDTSTNMLLPPTSAAVGVGHLLGYAVLAFGAVGLLLLRYRRVAAA
jgi:ABC-2 type transport system permease protein